VEVSGRRREPRPSGLSKPVNDSSADSLRTGSSTLPRLHQAHGICICICICIANTFREHVTL